MLAPIIFASVVVGIAMRLCGLSLWKFLRYLKDEIFVTFGTASTEAVLPQMLIKLEKLGCARPVVGMVLPTGYTFNADGTAIYLTMAAIFVAQAMNIHLSLVLLLGVDRFLNEACAVTNLIGNGVATVVVARWEKAIDMNRARAVLDRGALEADELEADEPGRPLVGAEAEG